MDNDIELILKEAKADLAKVISKLELKDEGIRERLKFKNRQLRKGREHSLAVIKEQMASSERKYESDKATIRRKIEALEAKLAEVESTHESRLEKHYHPMISSMYEKEAVEAGDISLPVSYHELNAHRVSLEAKVKVFQELVDKERLEAQQVMRLKYENKLKNALSQEPFKAKKKPKVAQKALVSQGPEEPPAPEPSQLPQPRRVLGAKKPSETPGDSIEFQRFQIDERWRMYELWRKRRIRIVAGQEDLPEASDPFWTKEAIDCMEPLELKGWGDIRQKTMEHREENRLQRELQRERDDREAQKEEEAQRARKLERAKMGLAV